MSVDLFPNYKPRDPKRIDRILELVRDIWVGQPDTRLGQLLCNFTQDSQFEDGGAFFYEDDKLERELQVGVDHLHRPVKVGQTRMLTRIFTDGIVSGDGLQGLSFDVIEMEDGMVSCKYVLDELYAERQIMTPGFNSNDAEWLQKHSIVLRDFPFVPQPDPKETT